MTESDIDNSNWYGWFNDEKTTKFMQKHYFPNTKELQKKFFRENIGISNKKLQLGICDAKGGSIVGVVSLNNIDYINRKAEISMIIGEAEYRKVKYMIEAFELLINHAFNSLNIRRIYGGTVVQELAELLSRALNFRQEGTLRQDVFKNGKYNDIYLIGLLKEEFTRRKNRNE